VSTSARSSVFQRLAVVTAVLALVLVALGGAVRATDSGLACPTWPGCFSAGDFLPPAGLNVWLEHSHRLVAGVVGLLIAAQAIWALVAYRDRRWIVWPAIVAAVAVVVQAALGALVVMHLLRVELVTAHLGMGMLVVACLVLIAVNATSDRTAASADARFTRAALGVAGLTFVQILVGGHVTGIAAGLAYTGRGFPAFGVATFGPIQTAPEAFNVVHRILAIAVAAAVMALIMQARKTGQTGWLLRLPRIAAWLVVLQIVIGVANLATSLSFLTVIPHLAVASWIWTVLVLTTVLAARPDRAGPDTPAAAAYLRRESIGAS
jgi:heme A synthase